MKIVHISLIFFATALTAFAQVDLTPIFTKITGDGVTFPVVNFRTASGKISYTPPTGWQLSGGGSSLKLIPPKSAQAEAEITVSAKPESADWDADSVKALGQRVLKTAPEKAKDVKLVGTQKNPLHISGHETCEVTISYTAFGQQFKKSLLVCNFANEQLRFSFVARSKDFDKLHAEFQRSLYSWDGLK